MHIQKSFRLLMAVISVLLTTTGFATEKPASLTSSSPVGYWKTIDDMTGKPKSIVHVFRNDNQQLMAKIVKVFPDTKTTHHQQPVVGTVIISGLKASEKQWANGHILDPENGKTYQCTARLVEHGKKLTIHGYTGFPLFGRSQTWERVDLMSG